MAEPFPLNNTSIICISSIDWDFIWQGHQEIMATFARHGNRVLFIENTGIRSPTPSDLPRLKRRVANWLKSLKGFREAQDRLWVYSPVILPFPYSRLAQRVNRRLLLTALRRWMEAMEFHDPIIWTFLPTRTALGLLDQLPHKLAVYYCIADFEQLVPQPWKVRRTEEAVVKRCNLIFAQGEVLAEKCRRWNSEVFIFPFGVNVEVFEDGRSSREEVPQDLRGIPRPIIGYLGGLHRHVDLALLRFIAEQRRNWSFACVGPIQTDISVLRSTANIFMLGEKTFTQLPHYIRAFDVGIIPYVESTYTKTVFPTKLNEYHAMGKPVVSTSLPEVVAFNARYGSIVHIAEEPTQFLEAIQKALTDDRPELAQRRVEVAREQAWSTRIEQMSVLINTSLQRKFERVPDTWQDRFLAVYRLVKQRTVMLTGLVLIAYLTVFYSPLVWWVAAPLKLAQPPRPADAVVVFAGGVGESGEAGQGYEERVQYAVQLYQQGWVPRLIFSSGYLYRFKEPFVMKALAVQLGVPAEAILLETQAASTYENVVNTANILDTHGWRSILFVSSPYHMRRALLVWRKLAAHLHVTPTPILETEFYRREGRVRVRQLRAIVHEYLAIVYYAWRGLL